MTEVDNNKYVVSGMTCGGCIVEANGDIANTRSALDGVIEDILAIDWSLDPGDNRGRAPLVPGLPGKPPEERVLPSEQLQFILVPRVDEMGIICTPDADRELPIDRPRILDRLGACIAADPGKLEAMGDDLVAKLIRMYLRSEGAVLKYPTKRPSATDSADAATTWEAWHRTVQNLQQRLKTTWSLRAAAAVDQIGVTSFTDLRAAYATDQDREDLEALDAAEYTAETYLPGHGIRDPLLRGFVNTTFTWKVYDEAQTIQRRLRGTWLGRGMERLDEEAEATELDRGSLYEKRNALREACYGSDFAELAAEYATQADASDLEALAAAEARGPTYYIGYREGCEKQATGAFVTTWTCTGVVADAFPPGSLRLMLRGVRARFAYYLARVVMGGASAWNGSTMHGIKWVADTFKKVSTPASALAPSELRDTGLPSLNPRAAAFRLAATYDTLFGYNPDKKASRAHSKASVYARKPLNYRYTMSWDPDFVPHPSDLLVPIACACARVFAASVTLDHVYRARETKLRGDEADDITAVARTPLVVQCADARRENYVLEWLFRCGLAAHVVTAGRVTESNRSGAQEWAAFVAGVADWIHVGEVRKYTGGYVPRCRPVLEATPFTTRLASLERDVARPLNVPREFLSDDNAALDAVSYRSLCNTALHAGNVLYYAAPWETTKTAYNGPNIDIVQSAQAATEAAYRMKSRQRIQKKFSEENMKERKVMRVKRTVDRTIKGDTISVTITDIVEVPNLGKWIQRGLNMTTATPSSSSDTVQLPAAKKRKVVTGTLDAFVKKMA